MQVDDSMTPIQRTPHGPAVSFRQPLEKKNRIPSVTQTACNCPPTSRRLKMESINARRCLSPRERSSDQHSYKYSLGLDGILLFYRFIQTAYVRASALRVKHSDSKANIWKSTLPMTGTTTWTDLSIHSLGLLRLLSFVPLFKQHMTTTQPQELTSTKEKIYYSRRVTTWGPKRTGSIP